MMYARQVFRAGLIQQVMAIVKGLSRECLDQDPAVTHAVGPMDLGTPSPNIGDGRALLYAPIVV
jgi:hypothetical protein